MGAIARRARGPQRGSVTDLVIRAIEEAGRPLDIDELERELQARGYRHRTKPKNAQQLRASIAAVPSKSTYVKRAGRGVYALTSDTARARML